MLSIVYKLFIYLKIFLTNATNKNNNMYIYQNVNFKRNKHDRIKLSNSPHKIEIKISFIKEQFVVGNAGVKIKQRDFSLVSHVKKKQNKNLKNQYQKFIKTN